MTDESELRAACISLDQDGFCVVTDVLDEATVREARDRVLRQAAAERDAALDFEYPADAADDEVNQWVYQLLNKGEVFHQLPVHPVAKALATHLLGEVYLLSTLDSHVTYPNNKPMPLHADQWWMPPPMTPGQDYVRQGDITRTSGLKGRPDPASHPITGPLILNIMWMMTDFTIANGATRLVPGSHLSGCIPTAGETYEEVVAEGSAGSIVAWDGRTWHGSGLNTSDGARVGVTTYFSGPMIRSLGNQLYGTRTDVLAELDPDLRGLIGFTPWNSYGMTDDPDAEFVRAGDDTAPEVH